MADAVIGERPCPPGLIEPVRKLGSALTGLLNPNSRCGRRASPIRQGRDYMDRNAVVVGIDVSRYRLIAGSAASKVRLVIRSEL